MGVSFALVRASADRTRFKCCSAGEESEEYRDVHADLILYKGALDDVESNCNMRVKDLYRTTITEVDPNMERIEATSKS